MHLHAATDRPQQASAHQRAEHMPTLRSANDASASVFGLATAQSATALATLPWALSCEARARVARLVGSSLQGERGQAPNVESESNPGSNKLLAAWIKTGTCAWHGQWQAAVAGYLQL